MCSFGTSCAAGKLFGHEQLSAIIGQFIGHCRPPSATVDHCRPPSATVDHRRPPFDKIWCHLLSSHQAALMHPTPQGILLTAVAPRDDGGLLADVVDRTPCARLFVLSSC